MIALKVDVQVTKNCKLSQILSAAQVQEAIQVQAAVLGEAVSEMSRAASTSYNSQTKILGICIS